MIGIVDRIAGDGLRRTGLARLYRRQQVRALQQFEGIGCGGPEQVGLRPLLRADVDDRGRRLPLHHLDGDVGMILAEGAAEGLEEGWRERGDDLDAPPLGHADGGPAESQQGEKGEPDRGGVTTHETVI